MAKQRFSKKQRQASRKRQMRTDFTTFRSNAYTVKLIKEERNHSRNPFMNIFNKIFRRKKVSKDN